MPDFGTIFSVLQKGLKLIPTLIEAGREVTPVITDLIKVSQDAKEGTLAEDGLEAVEKRLDEQIDEFNQPME